MASPPSRANSSKSSRCFHIHIAALRTAQNAHAFTAQAHTFAALRTFGDFNFGAAAIYGRDFYIAAQSCHSHGHRSPAIKMGAVSLKQIMGFDSDKNIKIAALPGAAAFGRSVALSGQSNARPVFHARWDVHIQRCIHTILPGAVALPARIGDIFALTAASGTSPFHGKEALLGAHTPRPAAG